MEYLIIAVLLVGIVLLFRKIYRASPEVHPYEPCRIRVWRTEDFIPGDSYVWHFACSTCDWGGGVRSKQHGWELMMIQANMHLLHRKREVERSS